jgi:hypothetical protein
MNRQLIGQVLNRMGKLSPMDIDEILEEQAHGGRRFGEIAMQWGLCEPEQIGEAWCRQLAEEGANLNLNKVGIDAHAAHCLPPALARRLGVMPIRALGEMMIVAASRAMDSVEIAELSCALAKDLRFVTVDAAQIQQAMEVYYRVPVAA